MSNKLRYNFTFLFLLSFLISNAQEQTAYIPIKDDVDIFSRMDQKNENHGQKSVINPVVWTWNSYQLGQGVIRSLIKPSQENLPEYSKIIKVELCLFHTSENGLADSPYRNQQVALDNNSNAGKIYPITSTWDENTVTWNSQPTYSTEIYATINKSTSTSQNYTIDVTELYKNFLESNEKNGWIIVFDEEKPYKQLLFASSENSNTELRPVLKFTYLAECVDKTLKLYPTADADVFSRKDQTNINDGNSTNINPLSWTWNADHLGDGTTWSYINFNFDSIPVNANIESANLHLFHTSGGNAGSPYSDDHVALSGSNNALIYNVSSQWTENTITWNNKPMYYESPSVLISESTSSDQDYIIDVSDLILNDPNNGWVIRLGDESPYKQLIFGSRNNVNVEKRPYLIIEYNSCSVITAVKNEKKQNNQVSIFPNPFSESFHINYNNNEDVKSVELLSLSGELIMKKFGKTDLLNTENLRPGTYLLKVIFDNETITSKVIKY